LHHDTRYPAGSLVLEAGCGVGAQTVMLARNSPQARFVAVDVSSNSLALARGLAEREGLANVEFQPADMFALPFGGEHFDHVFVCYILEHLADPSGALLALRRVLKSGGTLTVIEGDHGSCYWHPETDPARRAWNGLIQAQALLGGDALIGRRLFPLLQQTGFRDVRVSPRMVYCDQNNLALVDGFVRKTIIAMLDGVKARALEMGLIDEADWNAGLRDLHRVADSQDGTFCYTFFKAFGTK
jgi:SAM-dependent methyltransferase